MEHTEPNSRPGNPHCIELYIWVYSYAYISDHTDPNNKIEIRQLRKAPPCI